MPLPYDQFLLMRGVALGHPGDIGLALAREAGRSRKLVAGAGSKLYNTTAHTQGLRTIHAVRNEDQKAAEQRSPLKAAQLNALDAKYRKQ